MFFILKKKVKCLTLVVLYFVDYDNFEKQFEFYSLLLVLSFVDFLFHDVFELSLFDVNKDVLVLDVILIKL